MRIEHYSEAWLPDVKILVEAFHEEAVGEYNGLVDKERVLNTITTCEPENAFLMVIDGKCQGLLYGVSFLSMTGEARIFQEVMWYVNKPFRRYGIKLLKEVENILKSRGVNTIIMAVLENSKSEKLKRFYAGMGFRKMEEHWIREI